MIIDFHTHIFPDAIAGKSIEVLSKVSGIRASTDGTLHGLMQSMERAGVDMSVIMPVATKPAQFQSVNQFAREVNNTFKDRLISFGGIHPDTVDYKNELRMIKEYGLPGIKLHPDYQGVMIDDIRYMRIIEFANELDLIILTHAGIDIGLPEPVHCTPQKIRYILDKIQPKRFVAAHMGGWKLWDDVMEYLIGENVYLDTAFSFSYMEDNTFMKLWESHHKDKVLFASDSPWGDVSVDINAIRNLPISEADKKAIFSENARKLLRMK